MKTVLFDKVAHDFVMCSTQRDTSTRRHTSFPVYICRQSKYLPIIFHIKRLKVHHFHSHLLSLCRRNALRSKFCPPFPFRWCVFGNVFIKAETIGLLLYYYRYIYFISELCVCRQTVKTRAHIISFQFVSKMHSMCVSLFLLRFHLHLVFTNLFSQSTIKHREFINLALLIQAPVLLWTSFALPSLLRWR